MEKDRRCHMLQLKPAGNGNIVLEHRFVQETPEDENGFTNPWHGLSLEDYKNAALPEMIAWSKGENLPEGFVPESFFFLWKDDEIVGQFRIRHLLCESLREGAGHIGYCIRAGYRGRGYGTEGLRLALEIARKIIPEDEIYLRVNHDNPSSLRIMLKNGGVIHHSDTEKIYVRIRK